MPNRSLDLALSRNVVFKPVRRRASASRRSAPRPSTFPDRYSESRLTRSARISSCAIARVGHHREPRATPHALGFFTPNDRRQLRQRLVELVLDQRRRRRCRASHGSASVDDYNAEPGVRHHLGNQGTGYSRADDQCITDNVARQRRLCDPRARPRLPDRLTGTKIELARDSHGLEAAASANHGRRRLRPSVVLDRWQRRHSSSFRSHSDLIFSNRSAPAARPAASLLRRRFRLRWSRHRRGLCRRT